MKRWAARILVFLFFGAIANVVMAWLLAVRVPMDSKWVYGNVGSTSAWQPFDVLGMKREGFVSVSQWQRFGSTNISILAGQHQRTPDTAPSGDPLDACPSWCRGRLLDALEHSERVVLAIEARGWPARSLWCEPARMDVTRTTRKPARGGITIDDAYAPGFDMYSKPALPLIPIFPGFAINTVFYAVILWGFVAAPFTLRQRRRIKRGLCAKCAYDLRASLDAGACPECGATRLSRPR